jgi:hypothetical protein
MALLVKPETSMDEILDIWEPKDGQPGSVYIREWWNGWA